MIQLLVAAVIVASVLMLRIPAYVQKWLFPRNAHAVDRSGPREPLLATESNDVFRTAQLPLDAPARSADAKEGQDPLIDLPSSLFSAVRDNTPYRRQEQEALLRTMAAMAETSMNQLRRSTTTAIGFRELSQQPDAYRGRLVKLQGTVRRIHRLEAPTNKFGIEHFWQCWLRPALANDPIVVYTSELPVGVAEGMELSYDVDVVGVFFKLWAYPAARGIRTAPLVIGRIALARRSDLSHTNPKTTAPEADVDAANLDKVRAVPLGEFWDLFGFDDEWWQQFADGTDASKVELAEIKKLLVNLNRVPRSSLEREQQRLPPADTWMEGSSTLRGTTFAITGRLQSHQDLGDGYGRNLIKLEDSDTVVEMVTPRLTRTLQSIVDQAANSTVDLPPERVSATAIHMKFIGEAPDRRPLLAARRLAWHPDRIDPAGILTTDHLFLADLGFDVGLLDEVVSRSAITWTDREGFYQLLAAMDRTTPAALDQATQDSIPVSQLLQHEGRYRGRLCDFTGNARSVTRVAVDDQDIRYRLGIDHYYEIVVFVRPDVRIQFVGPEDERKEFATYPIVFCCRDIPPQLPVGSDNHVPVRVRGVFLKNWAYSSQFITGSERRTGSVQMQFSPLLIGLTPEILPTPTMKAPGLDRLIAVLIVGGLIGAMSLIWWFGRQDRLAERRRSENLPTWIDMPPE